MTRSASPRVTDEEATLQRFTALEPLNQLQDIPPADYPQTAAIDSDIPPTSKQRRRASSLGESLDHDTHLSEKVAQCLRGGEILTGPTGREESVFYLAYGSNLASKTFLGKRGIRPLSQVLVLVPELQLTFNLPGVPYAEPCFASTQFRNPNTLEEQEIESDEDIMSDMDGEFLSEKLPLVSEAREIQTKGHSHRWDKPLVGVVYEVTLTDYAKIIASEGGGGGYRDIVVDCHAFPDDYNPSDPVPSHPDTLPFKAHTLLSQTVGGTRSEREADQTDHELVTPASYSKPSLFDFGPHMRPNRNNAQPSARYLNLIITGASEHNLPLAYQEYLSGFHPYQITSLRQKVGKVLVLVFFGPIIISLLGLCKKFGGPDGRSPSWLLSLLDLAFTTMWLTYDYCLKPIFGDGERTVNT